MADRPSVRFFPASDRSLLVSLGDQIDAGVNKRVTQLLRLLQAEQLPAVLNLHPAYCSLLVTFDPLRLTHAQLEALLRRSLDRIEASAGIEPRMVEIPVWYGSDSGPDLHDVAKLHKLAPDEVIALHSSTTYVVYFLGFVPGFAYLGDLPDALVTPRLAVPRKAVPPGSVGIAGRQTGIYPLPTPGGWRLLGRTPLTMFRANPNDGSPNGGSLLATGDHVRFSPISREDFAALEQHREPA